MRRIDQVLVASACALLLIPSHAARAQSVTDRPPVMSGDWVGFPGILYFHFIHRFTESGAPEHKVSNTPTFVLAAALPWHALAGVSYATNSIVVPNYPNEHEYFMRVAPLAQERGGWVDLGAQGDYNDAVRGMDGEVSLARTVGPLRVLSAARVLSGVSDTAGARVAIAAGAVLHVLPYVALAGDIGSMTHRDAGEQIAWSAGLQLQIPLTPHTLSLQATNVGSNTLQGASRGTNRVRYGFEFTIPLTLRRYFGARAPGAAPATSSPSDSASARAAAATGAVTIVHLQGMAFRPGTIEIARGTTIEFHNDDPLGHTVTASDGSFHSPLIEPGRTWAHTFSTAGTFTFHCTPHPFMTGTIVVH